MAIRFQCQCGKSLKAREESAGKRTKCPQCGMPVGIPSLEPTHRGIVSTTNTPRLNSFQQSQPLTGEEIRVPSPTCKKREVLQSRRKRANSGRLGSPVHKPAPDQIEMRPRRQPSWVRLCGPRGRRTTMTDIGSPEPAISFIGFVAVATAACAVVIRLLPLAVQEGWLLWPHGPISITACLVLVSAVGYYCNCATQVLKNALQGKRQDYSFEVRLEDALVTLGIWVALFVAGPILPAAIAIDYWIRCGTATPFDWLVLVGVSSVSLGYWMALLISVNTGGGLQSLSPKRVLACFEQLGQFGIVGSAILALLLFALLKLAAVAAAWIHNDEVSGYLLLGVGFVAGPLMLAMLIRRMGETHRRAVIRHPHDSPVVSTVQAIPSR